MKSKTINSNYLLQHVYLFFLKKLNTVCKIDTTCVILPDSSTPLHLPEGTTFLKFFIADIFIL